MSNRGPTCGLPHLTAILPPIIVLFLVGCGRLGYATFDRVEAITDAGALDVGTTTSVDSAVAVDASAFVDGGDRDAASLPDGRALDSGGMDAGGTDAGGSDAGPCSPRAGLVVAFSFEEGAGSSTNDSSGSGNHGSLSGGTTWVTGAQGTGLRFSGTNGEVNAGSDPVIDDLTTFTVCAWVFPERFSTQWPAIADKSRDTFTGGWNFYLENDNTFGLLTNRRRWATGGTIALNSWQHLCASWDGTGGVGGIALYADGVSVPRSNSGNNGAGTDSDSSRDLLVGRVNNGTFPFDGVIDDFRLYNRVLTPAEISTIHGCANP